jgi:hypothetical protein
MESKISSPDEGKRHKKLRPCLFLPFFRGYWGTLKKQTKQRGPS